MFLQLCTSGTCPLDTRYPLTFARNSDLSVRYNNNVFSILSLGAMVLAPYSHAAGMLVHCTYYGSSRHCLGVVPGILADIPHRRQ